MTLPHSCSAVSARIGEPAPGTAASMRGWLLIEHPGPWAAKAVEEVVPGSVLARFAERGVRTLLVRRPGRSDRAGRRSPGDPWRVMFALAGEPIRAQEVPSLEDLSTVDDGDAVAGPLLLVCTHSARDTCCAMLGRPVAARLASAYGDLVWESTHLGGHRFAGNLLTVPDGYLYGRLDPETAHSVARATMEGRVVADHLRGRTTVSPAEQAAEIAVRQARHLERRDSVRIVGADHGTVTLDAEGERIVARVQWRASGLSEETSCGDPVTAGRWDVSL